MRTQRASGTLGPGDPDGAPDGGGDDETPALGDAPAVGSSEGLGVRLGDGDGVRAPSGVSDRSVSRSLAGVASPEPSASAIRVRVPTSMQAAMTRRTAGTARRSDAGPREPTASTTADCVGAVITASLAD